MAKKSRNTTKMDSGMFLCQKNRAKMMDLTNNFHLCLGCYLVKRFTKNITHKFLTQICGVNIF